MLRAWKEGPLRRDHHAILSIDLEIAVCERCAALHVPGPAAGNRRPDRGDRDRQAADAGRRATRARLRADAGRGRQSLVGAGRLTDKIRRANLAKGGNARHCLRPSRSSSSATLTRRAGEAARRGNPMAELRHEVLAAGGEGRQIRSVDGPPNAGGRGMEPGDRAQHPRLRHFRLPCVHQLDGFGLHHRQGNRDHPRTAGNGDESEIYPLLIEPTPEGRARASPRQQPSPARRQAVLRVIRWRTQPAHGEAADEIAGCEDRRQERGGAERSKPPRQRRAHSRANRDRPRRRIGQRALRSGRSAACPKPSTSGWSGATRSSRASTKPGATKRPTSSRSSPRAARASRLWSTNG